MRVFHTADVHVGLKFTRGYSETLQKALVAERVAVVSRMADLANQDQCDLFVVAGDLFDNVRVSKASIRATAEALTRFEGLVAVLPGNHDYLQRIDDSLWPTFTDALGERHLLLQPQQPSDLSAWDLPAILYPGVCTSKHSSENAVGWIPDAIDSEAMDKIRLGIAHGSLDGLSPDFNKDYFPMTAAELESIDVHAWLLGHTHVRFPDVDTGRAGRLFYPSTPEPDGFDCRHGGYAWIIDIETDGSLYYRSANTGAFQFHQKTESQIESEADLARFCREFEAFRDEKDLVKLKLQGRLNGELFDQVTALQKTLENCVRHLEIDSSELLRVVQQADIDAEFTQNSFPHRLLSTLAQSDEDLLALQIAYDLVKEAKQ
jgi:DNA repair exonuclease SbcCD nuclease subunit